MDSSGVVNRRSSWTGLVRIARLGVSAAVVATILGCGWAETEQAAEDAAAVEKSAAAVRGSRPESPGFRALREARGPYLAIRPVVVERARLPEDLRGEDGVVVPLGDGPADDVLAGRIEEASGLTVVLGPGGPIADVDPDDGLAGQRGAGLGRRADNLTLQGGLFVGSLDRLLDEWAEVAGYEWRYRAASKTIEVVRWTTRVFQVNALASNTTYDARIATSGGGGDDAKGTSRQSIKTDFEYKPWEDIEKEVNAIVGVGGDGAANARGETAVVSPSSATVTVTGSPETVERVRGYLGHLNRNILRPITLSAHLYALRLDRGADLELGLGGIIPEIFGSNLQVNLDGGTVSIVTPTVAAHSSLNATVTALRSVGTTTRILSADIPSLNGQPTQFFDVFDHRYLKEVSTDIDDGVVSVKLKPGAIWSGFGLSYVGRVVGNDGVLARITVTIQDAPTFAVFGSAGNQIQLPSAGRRAVVVTQHIERGAVLLLSGFSDRQSTALRAGTFDPDIPLPEGERRGSVDRVETVLLVTADVGSPMGVMEMSSEPVRGPGRPRDYGRLSAWGGRSVSGG